MVRNLVKRFTSVCVTVGLVVILGGCGSTTPSAPPSNNQSSAASFYKGKTLHIIVPYGPGGGYDQWARLISPYMQKYLGVAKVEVLNVPGGGGIVGNNQIYAAQPDGLTIGDTDAAGDLFAQIGRRPGIKFDVTKFGWIGRPDNDPESIAVHPNGPYQSFTDLLKGKGQGVVIKALASGLGQDNYNSQVITYNAFGIPFHIVAAFASSKELKATWMSGDGTTMGASVSDLSQIPNQAKIILVIGSKPFDKLPTTPTAVDLAKQEKLPDSNVNALEALAGMMSLGHAFFAPPGLPADRLAALQNAFKQSLADPVFTAAAEKAHLYLGYAPADYLKQATATGMSKAALFTPLLKTP